MIHRRIQYLATVGLVLSLGVVADAAHPADRTYAAGRFALQLDGGKMVPIGKLPLGRDGSMLLPRAGWEVRIRYDKAADSPALMQWISASFKKQHMRKSGAIVAADFNYESQSTTEFRDALITEISFPALDGSSKEPAYITIRIKPEQITPSRRIARAKDPADMTIKFRPKITKKRPNGKVPAVGQWQASNFKVEIGGLPCRSVTKVEGFTIKQTVQPAASKMILACPDGAFKAMPAEFKSRTFKKARSRLGGSVIYRDVTLEKGLMEVPFRVVAGRSLGRRLGTQRVELQVVPLH